MVKRLIRIVSLLLNGYDEILIPYKGRPSKLGVLQRSQRIRENLICVVLCVMWEIRM